jgi:hypothetical protein
MRRFHRRGQHEIPLHWIFALVGGALFLLFFFILIRSVTTQHQGQSDRELAFAVQTIVTTAAATPDLFTVTDLQNAKYVFACERDAASFLSYVFVEGPTKPAKAQLDTENLRYVPVFSPSTVNGDQLFTSTRAWEAPFQIGSLVLLSNNRTRYVFAYGSGWSLQQMKSSFVAEENIGGFGHDFVPAPGLSGYQDAGFDQYRVVLFTTTNTPVQPNLNSGSALKNPKNSALVVHTTDAESGTLDFYNDLSNTNGKKQLGVPFVGRAMLDAAIFSQDNTSFDCNMAKALERLNTTITILQHRLDTLGQDPNLQTKCGTIFDDARTWLNEYRKNPKEAFMAAGGNTGPLNQLSNIYQQAVQADCPSIY